MIVWGWLFVGLVGLVSMRYALGTAQDEVAIVTALVAMGAWVLWGWQALNVEVVSNGETLVYQYPAMTFFAAGVALVNLYIVLTGPVALIAEQPRRDRDERMVQ